MSWLVRPAKGGEYRRWAITIKVIRAGLLRIGEITAPRRALVAARIPVDVMDLCDLDPLLPLIGIGLSGLALLATLILIQRVATLEVRDEVAQELADSEALHDPSLIKSHQSQLIAQTRETQRNYRYIILLAPALLLLLGCSFLLYKTTMIGCEPSERPGFGSSVL